MSIVRGGPLTAMFIAMSSPPTPISRSRYAGAVDTSMAPIWNAKYRIESRGHIGNGRSFQNPSPTQCRPIGSLVIRSTVTMKANYIARSVNA